MYHVLFENLTWGQHLAVMKAATDAGADGEPKSHGPGGYLAPPAEAPPAPHPAAAPVPHVAPPVHAQVPQPVVHPNPPLTHT